jgi:hypothetical protein
MYRDIEDIKICLWNDLALILLGYFGSIRFGQRLGPMNGNTVVHSQELAFNRQVNSLERLRE